MFSHGRIARTEAEMVGKDRLQMVCDNLLRMHLTLLCRPWEYKHFVFLYFIFIFLIFIFQRNFIQVILTGNLNVHNKEK